MKRTAGTVRFAPYFRVQKFNPRLGAWVETKGRFDTEEEARTYAATQSGETRIRRIAMEGQTIL